MDTRIFLNSVFVCIFGFWVGFVASNAANGEFRSG